MADGARGDIVIISLKERIGASKITKLQLLSRTQTSPPVASLKTALTLADFSASLKRSLGDD